MSTANCRRCGQLISFALASNGRWRPVEASYTAIELEEDEVTVLRIEGNWATQVNTEIRVYRFHRCPEDPALRRGTARTVVVAPEVDERTGVVVEPERCSVCRQERHLIDGCCADCAAAAAFGTTCGVCGEVDDHNEDECPEDDEATARNVKEQRHYAYCKRRIPSTQVGSACPVCLTVAGEPCFNTNGGVRSTTHPQRGWVTAFDDNQPWPPEPTQRGYAALNNWLCVNYRVLTNPATLKENP